MKLVTAAIVAIPLYAQNPDVVVKVEKQQNAQAQIDYARSLMSKIRAAGDVKERHTAVAKAAANLMAVERAWPNNRAAVIEANALLAELYVKGQMPANAIETAERGLALAPDDHRLHVAAARAYARLDKKADAVAAYTKAVESFHPGRQDMMASLSAMNEAATYLEKAKEHGVSAEALRHAATIKGLTPMVRVTLRVRALEQSALAGNRGKAKDDLAQLREAHRVALGTSMTPAQRDLLTVAEKAIKKFEGSL